MEMFIWLTMSTIISAVNSAVQTYNAALNRPAHQSSTHRTGSGVEFPARYGNDGSRHTTYSTGPYCAVTKNQSNPWWAVDLQQPTTVYGVNLTTSRFTHHKYDDFVVGLTNSNPTLSTPTPFKYEVCGRYPGAAPYGRTVSVNCLDCLPPFRYVIVQLPLYDHLVACEVEVLVRVKQTSERPTATVKIPLEEITTASPTTKTKAGVSVPVNATTGSPTSYQTDAEGLPATNNSLLPAVIVVTVIAVILLIAGVILLILYIRLRAASKQQSEKTPQRGIYEPAREVKDYAAFAPPNSGDQELEMSPR